MPTYAYRCADCGHAFEEVQRFSDDPLTVCAVCAGGIRRVIHPVGVVFKGSGWYITDSRGSNGTSEKPANDGKGETGDAPGKSAKSATEPAAASSASPAKAAAD